MRLREPADRNVRYRLARGGGAPPSRCAEMASVVAAGCCGEVVLLLLPLLSLLQPSPADLFSAATAILDRQDSHVAGQAMFEKVRSGSCIQESILLWLAAVI